MSRPKILVLMATFNGSSWIEEQLDSILNQTSVLVHIVISDDGSRDDTRMRVLRYTEKHAVTLTSPPNPTGSAAQNFFSLIRKQNVEGYDYVAFSDQDDIWAIDKLYRAHLQLTATGAAGYSSAVNAVWHTKRNRVLRPATSLTSSDFLFEGAGQGCTFLLRDNFYTRLRDFLIANPDLTSNLHYHDWTTYALARTWGLTWTFDAEPSMIYRQHYNNDTGARSTLSGIRKRFSLIQCGWYRAQLSAIVRLCSAAGPSNPWVAAWREIFTLPDNTQRRLRVAFFSLRTGRRRLRDNLVLMLAAFAGWI